MRKQDVIFFWIPKTGGYSIYETLVKYGCIRKRWETPFIPFENKGISTFGHVDIYECLSRGVVTQDYFERAFKFCFVRNPWDRLVSLYFYSGYNDHVSFDDFVYSVEKAFIVRTTFWGRVTPRSRIARGLLNRITFLNPVYLVPEIGPFNVRGLSQANPQSDWVTDNNGNLIVDFVGKFENLEEDVQQVFDVIGIKDEIGHINKTQHKEYREYYLEKTQKIVGQIYQRDIKLFDYAF